MKAIVFHAHGSVDSLKYEDIPAPAVGPNEVLIRVRAVSLNGFDPMMLQGTTKLKTPFPMIPGGDFAGEIVELGSAVDASKWKPGDRVCPFPVIEGIGILGELAPGACREFITMPAANLLRMPDELSFVDAAALPIAYGTALRMMQTRGQVRGARKCWSSARPAASARAACNWPRWPARKSSPAGARNGSWQNSKRSAPRM